MANLTSIGVTSGIGSSGTGTVSTIDAMFSVAGTPSSVNVQTVQPSTAGFNVIISSGTIASISSGTVAISSITGGTITTVGSVTSLSSGTVFVSSGTLGVVASISSGLHAIANGANVAAVKAAQTAPSSNDPALVVSISPNSGLSLGSVTVSSITGGTITSLTSGSVSIISGGNTAAVKAANTAPSTTDQALVVAISPNSGLTLGSVSIQAGGNTASVKASATAPSTTDPALVVGLSPNSVDFGLGTAGSHTLRTLLDTSQVLQSYTSPQIMSASFQLVGVPTDATISAGGRTVTQATSVLISPSTTTAYAIGNLVANSTTAASIIALQWTTLARVTGGSGVIVGAALQKTSTATSSAAFRIHYFETAPVFGSGSADHVSITTGVQASSKGYIGYVDIPAMTGFSDVCWGTGAPDNTRGSLPYVSSTQTIYGLIEARGAYTPVSTSEVIIAYTMALQD